MNYNITDSNQTSSILSTILGGGGGEDESSKAKERTETSNSTFGGLFGLTKFDHMPFRKNMSWFSKTVDFPEIESINSPEVQAALWPKGADLLF